LPLQQCTFGCKKKKKKIKEKEKDRRTERKKKVTFIEQHEVIVCLTNKAIRKKRENRKKLCMEISI
jgi:hypothetical protein